MNQQSDVDNLRLSVRSMEIWNMMVAPQRNFRRLDQGKWFPTLLRQQPRIVWSVMSAFWLKVRVGNNFIVLILAGLDVSRLELNDSARKFAKLSLNAPELYLQILLRPQSICGAS